MFITLKHKELTFLDSLIQMLFLFDYLINHISTSDQKVWKLMTSLLAQILDMDVQLYKPCFTLKLKERKKKKTLMCFPST